MNSPLRAAIVSWRQKISTPSFAIFCMFVTIFSVVTPNWILYVAIVSDIYLIVQAKEYCYNGIMKGSAATIAIIVIVIIVALGTFGYIFLKSSQNAPSSSSSSEAVPSISVKDYAPSLPNNQKTTILIQSSD